MAWFESEESMFLAILARCSWLTFLLAWTNI